MVLAYIVFSFSKFSILFSVFLWKLMFWGFLVNIYSCEGLPIFLWLYMLDSIHYTQYHVTFALLLFFYCSNKISTRNISFISQRCRHIKIRMRKQMSLTIRSAVTSSDCNILTYFPQVFFINTGSFFVSAYNSVLKIPSQYLQMKLVS